MIKFAKVINKETGLCEIGLGTNTEFYKLIGMTEKDVKQSDIDNNWYLTDKCPMKDVEEIETERKKAFKSQFFEIKDFGWYRKQPKGYGSAIESLNTAFNIVSITGILPADTLTFYTEPNFAKEEQCTEEWLVFNSYKNERMTAVEFGEFYAKFVTAWNNEEHK